VSDMNIRMGMLIVLGPVALFHCSCSQKISTSPNIPVVIQGDEESKRKLEDIIKTNTKVIHPKTGIEYHLQIIEPDPKIDYKIVQIKPDENIDYKLIVIDPRTGKEIPELTEEISKEISKSWQQRNDPKKR